MELTERNNNKLIIFSKDNMPAYYIGYSGLLVFFFCLVFLSNKYIGSQKDDQPFMPANFSGINNISSDLTLLSKEKRKNISGFLTHSDTGKKTFSTNDLIVKLKANNLWDLSGQNEISSFMVSAFPNNLQQLGVETKKRAFFHTLLPIAKYALLEIESERIKLLNIVSTFPQKLSVIGSLTNDDVFPFISKEEKKFLIYLSEKYRTDEINELIARVDVIPVSLVLAQGAIESSWGTSRFATQGNNIFGVWTWGEEGFIPREREEDKTHKVARFDSILDSVRYYLLNLNRHDAYQKMREIRLVTENPLQLAEGLVNYSERGEEYVSDVKIMIDFNELRNYDNLHLADYANSLSPTS